MTPPTRRRAALSALAACLLIGIGVTATLIGREPPRRTPATTTTTTSTTAKRPVATTAKPAPTIPPLRPRIQNARFTIAKAKGPFVLVSREISPTAAKAKRVPLVPTVEPPRSNGPNSSDLPSADYPIEGRFVYGNGWAFGNPGAFGSPLTFLATAVQGDLVEVALPVRPNGTRGWVARTAVDLVPNNWHFEVILAQHRLLAWNGNKLMADTPVVIGTEYTQTPTGRHFITDAEAQSAGSKYGPWILGLNAYSEDMNDFDGGAPVIALHGWNDESAFGRSISNGCVRVPNDTIERLAKVPLGTPVDIWPT